MARKTIIDLNEMKASGQRVVFLTAYDAQMARLQQEAGVDLILVGDSVGNTLLGYDSTIPVTMDEMIIFTNAVRRGAPDTFIVGDMPFMSYQAGTRDAVLNAGRLVKEAGADSIKLEGGVRVAPQVRAIVDAGILVMGHIGLTPQSAGQFGGWRAQGRTADTAVSVLRDALALQEAGAFSILVEGVPAEVTRVITARLDIPIYGIGAGPHCDGQLLIVYDMLGLFEVFQPRFVKRYGQLARDIVEMLGQYRDDVQAARFPTAEHDYGISKSELEAFLEAAGRQGLI